MPAARVGDEHLAGLHHHVGEQTGERLHVSLLVENVCREHEIETRAAQGGGVTPVEQFGLDVGTVAFRVRLDEADGFGGPIAGNDAPTCERRGDRGESEATAELEHGQAGEIARGDVSSERDAGWPCLGPVRQELLVIERVLVEQRLGISWPLDAQRPCSDLDGLDDGVHLAARMPGMKKRLDVLLVERGLVETRSKAQALVLAGLVPGFEKPGAQVDVAAELTVREAPRFVSRGGEKLAHALAVLGVDPSGLDCLDVGASTGGFTDCLLAHGAARVLALDVGYGQLHPRLRGDRRVTVLERTNVRHVTSLPFPPELVVCDVSFIAVDVALPAALRLAAQGWEALVLVKPQFEAGRADAPKGVVRDPAVHRRVLRTVCSTMSEWGACVLGVVDSGLPGPKGNREFFVHLRASEHPADSDDVDRWIDRAVG